MKPTQYKDLPVLTLANQQEFLEWLKDHHSSTPAVWIAFAKKNTGVTTITYEEAREAAIMYGWIDGLLNKYDDIYYVIRFTPRKPQSVWSKINKNIVEELIKQNKMTPMGLQTIAWAKERGTWDTAYDSSSTITIPNDFAAALRKNTAAAAFFTSLNKVNRYAVLYRIQTTIKPEARKLKIERLVTMLADGLLIHPTHPKSKKAPE